MKLSDLKHLSWYREQEKLPGVFVRIKTKNPSNSIHANPYVEGRRRKEIRQATYAACRGRLKMANNLIVTLTRYSSGSLDPFDNLPSSLKNCVDGVADALGIDDRDPRVTWKAEQEKAPRGCFGVRIVTSAGDGREVGNATDYKK